MLFVYLFVYIQSSTPLLFFIIFMFLFFFQALIEWGFLELLENESGEKSEEDISFILG